MNLFKSTAAKIPEKYIAMIDEPRRSEMQKLNTLIRETVPELKSFIQSGMIGYGAFHYKSKAAEKGNGL